MREGIGREDQKEEEERGTDRNFASFHSGKKVFVCGKFEEGEKKMFLCYFGRKLSSYLWGLIRILSLFFFPLFSGKTDSSSKFKIFLLPAKGRERDPPP